MGRARIIYSFHLYDVLADQPDKLFLDEGRRN